MENSWEPVKTHDRWSIDGSFLERVIILELSPMAPENTKRSPWRPTSWCRACRRSWKVRPKVCRFSLGKFMGKSWETDFTRGWTGAANIFGKWYAFRSHTGRKARWSRVKGLKTDRQQPTSPWQFSQFGTLWWRWNPLWLGYTPPFYTLFFFWAGYHLMWLDGSEGQLTDFCEVAIGWSWNTSMSGENLQGSHMKSPFCPPSLRRNGGNPLAQHANSQFEKFQAGWWFQTFLWANCTATSARLVSSVNIQEPGF